MSIGKTRGFLYQLAKLLGDWQAVSSGSGKNSQTSWQESSRQGDGQDA